MNLNKNNHNLQTKETLSLLPIKSTNKSADKGNRVIYTKKNNDKQKKLSYLSKEQPTKQVILGPTLFSKRPPNTIKQP